VISPGPGTPDDAGICLQMISTLGPLIPIFGVCLGHQCIGQAFGAEVVRAERIMHGKTSMIYHRSQGVFKGLPQPFEATRYHSLMLRPESIPEELSVMAWCEYQGGHEVMGIKHNLYDIQGVQFHPESILTGCGHDLLRNFLQSISMLY
jgi:anthranilate synthase component 2